MRTQCQEAATLVRQLTSLTNDKLGGEAPDLGPLCALVNGVVISISGGRVFCRCRLEDGVSPVRVSKLTGSPISSTGRPILRCTSTVSALSGEI